VIELDAPTLKKYSAMPQTCAYITQILRPDIFSFQGLSSAFKEFTFTFSLKQNIGTIASLNKNQSEFKWL